MILPGFTEEADSLSVDAMVALVKAFLVAAMVFRSFVVPAVVLHCLDTLGFAASKSASGGVLERLLANLFHRNP